MSTSDEVHAETTFGLVGDPQASAPASAVMLRGDGSALRTTIDAPETAPRTRISCLGRRRETSARARDSGGHASPITKPRRLEDVARVVRGFRFAPAGSESSSGVDVAAEATLEQRARSAADFRSGPIISSEAASTWTDACSDSAQGGSGPRHGVQPCIRFRAGVIRWTEAATLLIGGAHAEGPPPSGVCVRSAPARRVRSPGISWGTRWR